MTYGKEDIDFKTEGNPNSGYIFNAALSVFWCRIRDLMHSQLAALYQSVDVNCWSATHLINEFDAWQNQFPEEIWRLDIQRKYYRTYEGGSGGGNATTGTATNRFLKTMMNGRKRYQRRQFERDQEQYMGTKYLTSSVRADQIMFRCNTPTSSDIVVRPDYTLRIVPYSDMYLSVLFGNSPTTNQIRAKAGQEYVIECPYDTMDDTAVLIYCANRIQELNDLSACYIHDNDFSKATRLKTLVIGNNTEGYSNTFLTSLNLGDNALLESLDIRNCPNLTGMINLAKCGNLVNFYATGTDVTGITFARNGKIVSAYLPDSLRTMIMQNLADLTDLQVPSYNYLNALTIEVKIDDDGVSHDVVGSLDIVNAAKTTLQNVRLLNIDWTVPDTSLLNTIMNMYSSTLTGNVYVVGKIRDRELDMFREAWPDLTVSYDSGNLIESYPVYFVNEDGSRLLGKDGKEYVQYVDRGATPINPLETGEIDTPTKASDQQYDYTYNGWNREFVPIASSVTFVATYSNSVRYYTVRWFKAVGDWIDGASVSVPYGSEAVYSLDLPTRTDMEDSFTYYVFAGWDKSTGYITENTDVFATWIRGDYPESGTSIGDMNVAQIYGICKARETQKDVNAISTFVYPKDNVTIELGKHPSFSNVERVKLFDKITLDGETVHKTGLFPLRRDTGWVIAFDIKNNTNTPANSVFMSCYNTYTQDGVEVVYSGGVHAKFGSSRTSTAVATNGTKEKVVLRHSPGSNSIMVYSSNCTADNIIRQQVLFTRNESIDCELIFGAQQNTIDKQYYNYAQGVIENAYLYTSDLGAEVCENLANWVTQTFQFEAYGFNTPNGDTIQRGTYITDGGTYTSIDFICRSTLHCLQQMNTQNVNAGGWEASLMRRWLNDRVFDAFPVEWKQIIKTVQVKSSVGNQKHDIVTSNDKLRLPSYTELCNAQNSPYINEVENSGTYIPWFTSDRTRIKWQDGVSPRDGCNFFQYNGVPTVEAARSFYDYQVGDVILNSAEFSRGYLEVDGKMVAAYIWWERSPHVGNSSSFMYVNNGGYPLYNGNASYRYAVCAGFSI